ncbi:unnamed protein product [Paramecium primaurelia]|uniref:ABC transporter domain-containing protein n=1 Tax=Paramecium primaurelia TaxID=5886 RepID=A0A8S1NKF1_PARPR|nr:unnamed protein product [Paramecium primaurelia]
MEKFLIQSKCVFLKSFYLHLRNNRLIPNILVPFLCGLILWLSYFKSLDFLKYSQTFYMPLAICGVIRSYMMMIVNEKKERQKENQLIMGLKLSAYYTGWIISCIMWTCICASIYIIMISSFIALNWHYFAFYQYAIFYLQYMFYSYAVVGQMLLISSLFSDGRKATDVYAVIYMIIVYLYYFTDWSKHSEYSELLLSIFPQNLIVYFWFQKITSSAISMNYIYTLIVFCIQGTIGILLYVYLDQVIPDAIGTHKSPFFIFQCLFKKKKNQVEQFEIDLELQQQNSLGSELLNPQDQIQPIEANENQVIKLTQLTKVYNGQAVVSNISLNLNKNTIFSLLGHNGAGKSTTVNMICGLIEKTTGQININGYDIDKNLDDIRQILGYCSQKDVLYGEMSVYDHLQFYGRLKLVNQLQLSGQIEYVLNMCHLQQEIHQPAMYLSGGGKRKLCLAIALIGNSQVLLLDEPTTGLDPISRQQIWNILKEIKQDRCIILTTHYLDEAQELSDYVGIIQQGKVTVFGTVDYIKRQFSVGYNILLECKNELHQKQILDQIQSTLQLICKNEIHFIPQNRNLKLNIPLSNSMNVASALEYLETVQNINISFEMTTLEDAYIKIHSQSDWGNNQIETDNNTLFNKMFFDFIPHFNFFKQVKGLFMRRLWISGQNKWQYVMFLIAWILLLGCLFGFNNITPEIIIYLYILIKIIFISQQSYYPIYEKQHKIKDSYITHGAKIISYWTSVFLFDTVVIAFEQIIFLALLLIAKQIDGEREYRQYNILVYFRIIFVNTIFSFALNCQTYFATYFFKNTYTSNVQLPFFLLTFQFLGIIIFTIIFQWHEYVGIIFPPIQLVYGYDWIFSGLKYKYLLQTQTNSIISIIFFFSIINYLEYRLIRKNSNILNYQGNVEVKQVNYTIGNRPILQNLNFSIESKEIFGLLGPNGAGKTSTFKIITREEQPTLGSVEIKNESTQVGLVPSFSPLHEDLSLVQHLKIYGSLKGLDFVQIENFIDSYTQYMDLKKIKDKRVKVLSGGERRKVQMGIALIGNSSILLMDEPTSGVDPVFRQQFQQLMLRNCQQNESSILITTHSMKEAQRMCEVLGIIINGQLKFKGSLNQLRQQYDNRIQLSFHLKNVEDKDKLRELIGQNLTKNIFEPQGLSGDNLTVFVDDQSIKFSQLFRFCSLRAVENIINDFEIQQATLDQIFKHYVQQQQVNDYPQQIVEVQQRSLLGICCCQI